MLSPYACAVSLTYLILINNRVLMNSVLISPKLRSVNLSVEKTCRHSLCGVEKRNGEKRQFSSFFIKFS